MFAELKNEVAELESGSAPYIPVKGEKRWSWFVALAVERYASVPAALLGGLLRFNFVCSKRFDIWCQTLRLEDAKRNFEEVLPPLDVITVISLS